MGWAHFLGDGGGARVVSGVLWCVRRCRCVAALSSALPGHSSTHARRPGDPKRPPALSPFPPRARPPRRTRLLLLREPLLQQPLLLLHLQRQPQRRRRAAPRVARRDGVGGGARKRGEQRPAALPRSERLQRGAQPAGKDGRQAAARPDLMHERAHQRVRRRQPRRRLGRGLCRSRRSLRRSRRSLGLRRGAGALVRRGLGGGSHSLLLAAALRRIRASSRGARRAGGVVVALWGHPVLHLH
ncbi:MAG: hypothetical protein J3K34DRAFT_406266 [Monoraphidium minutum]|nr:MAG: hypothetical protein J3K34DRAFT_406266 [Monoraphidium minutum]